MSNTFYTYLWLRDNGIPYYVGKGSGKRAFVSTGHIARRPTEDERIIVQEWPTEETAFWAERFLIALYGRMDLGTGCLNNRSDGGEGICNISEETRQKKRMVMLGRKASEETRAKLRELRKGKKFRLVYWPHTEEAKEKIRIARARQVFSRETIDKRTAKLIGQKRTIEQRQRMSKAQEGNRNALGHIQSAETKAKLRARHLGKKMSDAARINMSIAARGKVITQTTRTKISLALKGRPKGVNPNSG